MDRSPPELPRVTFEPAIPRIDLDREAVLYTALGVVGGIIAPAFPLAFEVSTFATDLFYFLQFHGRGEIIFLFPPALMLLLSFPLLGKRRVPRIPLAAMGFFVVLIGLALIHEYRIRTIGHTEGILNDILLYRYSHLILFFAIGAAVKNRSHPTIETAYLFCTWQVVWLFSLAFPGFSQLW